MKENLIDQFRYFVGGYYGVLSMDEYDTLQYILKDIEEYIRSFIMENPIDNFDYKKEAELVKETRGLKTKLQDALLVLYKIDAPMELIWMVKARLKEMGKR